MKEFIIVGAGTLIVIASLRLLIPEHTECMCIQEPYVRPEVRVTWVGKEMQFDTDLAGQIERELKLIN